MFNNFYLLNRKLSQMAFGAVVTLPWFEKRTNKKFEGGKSKKKQKVPFCWDCGVTNRDWIWRWPVPLTCKREHNTRVWFRHAAAVVCCGLRSSAGAMAWVALRTDRCTILYTPIYIGDNSYLTNSHWCNIVCIIDENITCTNNIHQCIKNMYQCI